MIAQENYYLTFKDFFSDDKKLLWRCFYFWGLFAIILIFFSFLTFFIYFLAEPTQAPMEVKISNVTDQSVTISWITTKKTKGLVVYTPAQTPRLLRPIALLSLPSNYRAFDQFNKPSTLHSVTITRLYSNINYLYRISTGLRTYKIDDRGNLLPDIKTAGVLNSLPLPNPIYGQINNNQNQTLVYLSLSNEETNQPQSTLLSTLTNQKGYYLFDLTGLRTTDLKSLPIFLPNTKIKITAVAVDFKAGEILVDPKNKAVEPISLK